MYHTLYKFLALVNTSRCHVNQTMDDPNSKKRK